MAQVTHCGQCQLALDAPSQQTSREEDTEPFSEPREGRSAGEAAWGGVGLSTGNVAPVHNLSRRLEGKRSDPFTWPLSCGTSVPSSDRCPQQLFLNSLTANSPLPTCAVRGCCCSLPRGSQRGSSSADQLSWLHLV